MKKIITTTVLALSLFVSMAQKGRGVSSCDVGAAPSPDAKLLSSSVEGGCRVDRWLVPSGGVDDREFSVRYGINISKMISTYDDNSKELSGLRTFLLEVMSDKDKTISRINIMGHSSPDGVTASNMRLATARAQDFRQYINREYNLSKYSGETKGFVYKWADTKSAIESSSCPQKSEVLRAISSTTMSEEAIENRLKSMSAAWGYIIRNILPKMRLVEMEVVYSNWCVKTVCTPITPRVEEVVENNYIFILNENSADVSILENEYAPAIDYAIERRRKYVFKENRRREKVKGYFIDSSGRERSVVKYK